MQSNVRPCGLGAKRNRMRRRAFPLGITGGRWALGAGAVLPGTYSYHHAAMHMGPTAKHPSAIELIGRTRAACLIEHIALWVSGTAGIVGLAAWWHFVCRILHT